MEIKKLRKELKDSEKQHEKKLQEFKNRLKSTEKDIYTKIESEYSELLKQKDEMLLE